MSTDIADSKKAKTCIVIVGPTAIGKTSFAIQVARHFATEIISSDSRQCFKELNIGVAKPSMEELQMVKHHFINSHSIHDTVNAGVFEQYALQKAGEIFKTNDVAVMVGGTGLYVKSFCYGIDELPVISDEIRENIIAEYEFEGMEWLQKEVEKNDPLYFAKGEIKNPQRLMRALEVKLSTGKSIIEFQTQEKKKRDFNIIQIGLEMPREDLYQRINDRVDTMMQQGLLEEVRGLVKYKALNALQTVGYRELFEHLSGDISLATAVDSIKTNTRQYAKRQMTWFKKDKMIRWIGVDDLKNPNDLII
ncbi:tRNA (adenosine(37)-N6)-dimethylallyltransferase MiaA [Ferruginibacter lapsinanis]|uniref:tRNA (adenosine(37)-N6)-dimethylallyltransferase MiaA n=1 Tax=Ferruginibacter lapsinanis TaxID=563172 RepID=UPI001E4475CB|nr:tRNA (adenosine(37)-N6)-dimethylallyltransferase MiaA [Ferruginibacter lapsinanis]UEG48708.1 tRNA (adenosine(37)-N6)-dimethylallyltransferase MiaA [Ferruginibacter lapsinanis]